MHKAMDKSEIERWERAGRPQVWNGHPVLVARNAERLETREERIAREFKQWLKENAEVC